MRWLMIFILMLAVSACIKEVAVPLLPEPVPFQSINMTEKGITLGLVKDEYSEPQPFIQTMVVNDSLQEYQIGGFYGLEMKKDGKWYTVNYSDAVFHKDPHFKDFGSVLEAQSVMYQYFSIESLGVTLVPGEYRLVKTMLASGTDYNELSVAATFTVK